MTVVAGTPFALEPIEFPVALEFVARHAVGPLGAARVRTRRPQADMEAVRRDLETVHQLAQALRESDDFRPEPIPDIGALLDRLAIPGSVFDGGGLATISTALIASRLTHDALQRVAERVPRLKNLVADLPPRPLEAMVAATVDEDGNVRDQASRALARIRRRLRDARSELVAHLEGLLRCGELGGAAPQATVTLRAARYVIPVRRAARARVPGIVHAESASGQTLFVEPAGAVEMGNALRALEADEAREVQRVLRVATERLREHVETIRAVWEMTVAADDVYARARYAVEVDGHMPELASAPAALVIRQGRHPLLVAGEAVRTAGAVVPFDLELTASERTVIISGPNAGGKTVLMKAVGLTTALAQAGIIPPIGPGSQLPIFHTLFADIGDQQSIAESLSTFSAHMVVLKDALDRAGARSLVLLDELGSGTDPTEGAALAGAALQALTERGAFTLATTHLGTLKELALQVSGVVNASLQFDAETLRPTYRLIKGVPGRSYAIAIARRLGIDQPVLELASASIPREERELDALLTDVERRRLELEDVAAVVKRRIEAADAQERAIAERAAALEKREARLKAEQGLAEHQARSAARRYLLDARKRVEEAIGLARAAVDEATAKEARRLLEEAAQAEAAAMKHLEGRGGRARQVAVGDRVRTGQGSIGTVREVRPDGSVAVELGSLRLVVEPTTLEVLPEAPQAGRTRPAAGSATYDMGAATTVDLRGLCADEARFKLMRALDGAVQADLKVLRVIHGKGTGALRKQVHQVLAGDPRVATYAFARPQHGGTGVTVVEFR